MKVIFCAFLGGLLCFFIGDEIISTMKSRYFQLKYNLCWHNCELFWHADIHQVANDKCGVISWERQARVHHCKVFSTYG